jgi:hypothetical protein
MLSMQNVAVTKKGEKGPVPARVFFILARNAPVGVVFRRGPSDWTEVLKWNTENDTFEPGQWFRGRIYERRCDLSPDGSLLIYFVRKITGRTLKDHEYTYAWTAVSKPPYLTALALWPKGDCWHGGGMFASNNTIVLNHKPQVAKPHPKHLPTAMHVRLRDNVCGEDDPIFSERLERDGWELKQEWVVENRGYPLLFLTREPEVREKQSPSGPECLQLTRSIAELDYSECFAVRNASSDWLPIEGASWADWDSRGRLVFARDGRLYAGALTASGALESRELIDINSHTPTTMRAPEWATRW